MASGPEHYRTAEALLQMASDHEVDPDTPYAHEQYLLAAAQVHATLALAAATALALAAATALAIEAEGAEPQIEAWHQAGAW
jgi:hypothetical protein